MTVIESKLKLVKVAIKMFHGKLMIRADNGSLKKRPDIFQRVCVGQTAHVFTMSMVNRNMDRIVVANSDIAEGALIVSVLGEVNTTRR